MTSRIVFLAATFAALTIASSALAQYGGAGGGADRSAPKAVASPVAQLPVAWGVRRRPAPSVLGAWAGAQAEAARSQRFRRAMGGSGQGPASRGWAKSRWFRRRRIQRAELCGQRSVDDGFVCRRPCASRKWRKWMNGNRNGSMNGMNGLGGLGGLNGMNGQLGQNRITIVNRMDANKETSAAAAETQEAFQHKIGCHVLFDRFDHPSVPNSKVASKLSMQLTKSKGISAVGPVTVEMQGQTAVLRGVVATGHDRDLAARLALLEPGVSQIQNELQVQESRPMTPAEQRARSSPSGRELPAPERLQ